MGVNVFPAPSGASLPPGATALVASGYVDKGYTNVTGSFPAGKYLVVSDSMCTVNFSNGKDVIGYQNSVLSRGGSCIVNVPVSSTNIDYVSGYSMEEFRSAAQGINNSAADIANVPVMGAGATMVSRSKRGSNYAFSEYQNGRAIMWTNSGSFDITAENSFGHFPSSGTLNLTAFNNPPTNTSWGWDGTTFRGYYDNSTNWSTTNLFSPSWSTNSVSPSMFTPQTIFGGGMWIQYGNSTTYRYSTNGTSWTSGTFPFSPGSSGPGFLVYGNGVWVLVSNSNSSTGQLAYSTNGTTWTTTSIGLAYPWNDAQSSWNGIAFGNGIFMVLGKTTESSTEFTGKIRLFTSRDGINWKVGAAIPTLSGSAAGYEARIIHDGVSFLILPYTPGGTGQAILRTFTGNDLIPTGRIATSSTALQFKGKWGKVMSTNSDGLVQEATKLGTYFEIYSLDSSKYPTY